MSNACELSPGGLCGSAVTLAVKMATKAPSGQRLGGPGTRSKNPKRFDKIGAERKAKENAE
jgi:hypothetical protein